MRKYALVILDNEDKIIDRYNLNIITNPTENGFKLNLSTISGSVEDVITKITQQKNVIKFNVNQYQNAYAQSNLFVNWIQKYTLLNYKMALEYDDGYIIKYCEGRVTSLTKTELDEYRNLVQQLEFTQTTPFFIKQENVLQLKKSREGKKYPYSYNYNYATFTIKDNDVNNLYIMDIPLIVILEGAITNPTIDLLDENGNRYSRVKFDNFILYENEKIIINSAQKKIYKITAEGVTIDFTPEVDPNFDVFLRAKPGTSKLFVNITDANENFKLSGSWRQYTL